MPKGKFKARRLGKSLLSEAIAQALVRDGRAITRIRMVNGEIVQEKVKPEEFYALHDNDETCSTHT